MLWFSFLKAFTRALTQINLYKPDHPQVRQSLDEGQALLAQITESLAGADFSVTLDHDKLLINGTPLLAADKLPNSLRNLFTKFRIQTITFKPGVTGDDLLALCQVQSHKGEAKDYLKERGIDRVKLDEAIYAKVASQTSPGLVLPGQGAGPGLGAGAGGGPGQGAGPGGGTAQAAPAAEKPAAEKVSEKILDLGLESALLAIVARVTPDPVEQRRLMEILTSKFKQEMETTVNRALEGLRGEKKKVENDMVRAQSVMTSMADGVVVVDKDGKILMMNPQAEAISGKPLAELSGKKIAGVNVTTRDALREELTEGVRAGEDVRALSKRVREVFDVADQSRAEMIARTEVVGASNWATYEAHKASGVVDKRAWVATRDGRAREEHLALDGVEVGLTEKFHVDGHSAMYPGGFGEAALDISCRCTTVAVIDDPDGKALTRAVDLDAIWKAFDDALQPWESAAKDALRTGFRAQERDIIDALEGLT